MEKRASVLKEIQGIHFKLSDIIRRYSIKPKTGIDSIVNPQ